MNNLVLCILYVLVFVSLVVNFIADSKKDKLIANQKERVDLNSKDAIKSGNISLVFPSTDELKLYKGLHRWIVATRIVLYVSLAAIVTVKIWF